MIDKKSINLLPIGTICKITDDDVSAMIIGYFEIDKKTKATYDYKAVIYPFGLLNADIHFAFNEKDIKEVLFKGFINQSFKAFERGVNKALNGEDVNDMFK